jgi:hypothetical protein
MSGIRSFREFGADLNEKQTLLPHQCLFGAEYPYRRNNKCHIHQAAAATRAVRTQAIPTIRRAEGATIPAVRRYQGIPSA